MNVAGGQTRIWCLTQLGTFLLCWSLSHPQNALRVDQDHVNTGYETLHSRIGDKLYRKPRVESPPRNISSFVRRLLRFGGIPGNVQAEVISEEPKQLTTLFVDVHVLEI
mgnify:CR=1 FL=1